MRKVPIYLRHNSGFILTGDGYRIIVGYEMLDDVPKAIYRPHNLTEAKQRYYVGRQPGKRK